MVILWKGQGMLKTSKEVCQSGEVEKSTSFNVSVGQALPEHEGNSFHPRPIECMMVALFLLRSAHIWYSKSASYLATHVEEC